VPSGHTLCYGAQRIFLSYGYLVPFVEDQQSVFLKTILPSRRVTIRYPRFAEQERRQGPWGFAKI
jgi:hypothetical protein